MSFSPYDEISEIENHPSLQDEEVSFTSYKYAIELQKEGFGMPLFELKFGSMCNFATINRFVTPPPHLEKPFDKCIDKYKVCSVYKKRGLHYSSYIFTIYPNDLTQTIEIRLFKHHKLPLADVIRLDTKEIYRWIHSEYHLYLLDYRYSLFVLDNSQLSMTDSMVIAKTN